MACRGRRAEQYLQNIPISPSSSQTPFPSQAPSLWNVRPSEPILKMSPQAGAPLPVNAPSHLSCFRQSASSHLCTSHHPRDSAFPAVLASEEMALMGTLLRQAFGQTASPGKVAGRMNSNDAHARWGLLLPTSPQGKAVLLQ